MLTTSSASLPHPALKKMFFVSASVNFPVNPLACVNAVMVCVPPSSVRSSELISAIRAAKSADNDAKAAKLIGGALKQLRLSRLKPDTTLNSALVTLVQEYPEMFSTPSVMEALVLVLKREPSVIFKARSNPAVYVLAAQLLLFALRESYDWPEMVAKVSIVLNGLGWVWWTLWITIAMCFCYSILCRCT